MTNLRLLEEYCPVGVNATGQQAGCHVQYAAPELAWVLRLGDGVHVYNAV